jgi:hypothetical protein
MGKIYQEKIPTYYFITVVVVVTCLLMAGLLLSQFTSRALPMNLATKIIVAIVLVLEVLVFISFRELQIELTSETLTFGFSRFRKRISLGEIESVEVEDYKFSNYFGYGIRYGRDLSTGYVPRAGKGIKIKLKNQKAVYFVISTRAEELKGMIEQNKNV